MASTRPVALAWSTYLIAVIPSATASVEAAACGCVEGAGSGVVCAADAHAGSRRTARAGGDRSSRWRACTPLAAAAVAVRARTCGSSMDGPRGDRLGEWNVATAERVCTTLTRQWHEVERVPWFRLVLLAATVYVL